MQTPSRRTRWWQDIRLLAGGFVFLALGIGVVIGTRLDNRVAADPITIAAPGARELKIPNAKSLATEFTQLARRLEPSVAHISTEYVNAAAEDEEEELGAQPKQPWHEFLEPRRQPNQRRPKREATGSGFIVDSNGFILTNHHVVERADQIIVTLPHDDSTYRAKLIGFDRETDLAVIKIDAGRPMQPVRIANSDSVQVGDWAVAIGSPFGLQTSVTAGIVSATGRDIDGAQQFQKFIQTDAAINPGNSGGPLLNIDGEVIGINTAIATDSGGYQGIGFALPMNVAVNVYNSIVKSGRVTRGSIGVGWDRDRKTQMTTLRAFGFQRGLLVESVEPGGPAEKAGIKVDDVILDLNGKAIRDGDDLVALVSPAPVGSEMVIGFDRQGKRLQKRVLVNDRAIVFKGRGVEDEDAIKSKPASQIKPPSNFGMELKGLTAGKKTAAEIENGVEINEVQIGSFAEDIGLESGDLIVAINRQPISSADEVRAIRAKLRNGDPVAFRILRKQGGGITGGKYVGRYVAGILPVE